MGCASPSSFYGQWNIFLMANSIFKYKAAVSSGADYVIKKETGKNKIEHFSSKILKKNCTQQNNLKVNCK